MAIGERGERRHLADQAIGLLLAGFRIQNILGVGIKSGKRGDGGDQHPHRVCVVVKSVEEFLDALVNESVVLDLVSPIGELRFRREVAVKSK